MSDEETDVETEGNQGPKNLCVRTLPWRAELLTALISMVDERIDHSNDHRRRLPGHPSERQPSAKVDPKYIS